MHATSRVLLVVGSALLVAFSPLAAHEAGPPEQAEAAILAVDGTAVTRQPGDLLDRLLQASRTHVAERTPEPHRSPGPGEGPCPSGVVVLTFDDGPDPMVTPRLLRTLTDLQVPATFFMVGHRVAAVPGLARQVHEAGFTVANHSYRHDLMTNQTDRAIRTTLRRTRREMRAAGVRPSRLMRPPYGGTDRRVDRAIRSVGLVPVLWDVDPRDWERRSTADIAAGVLSRLRPGRRNIVLQHDGVRNSPNSVAAVPRIVREARRRGYCFGDLDPSGRPYLPTPQVSATAAPAREGDRLVLGLRLNAPANKPTSVLVTTADGTAVAGRDYRPREVRVTFPAGRARARVAVRTRSDDVDERTERFTFTLTEPEGLTIGTPEVIARIIDATPAPKVRVVGSRTTAADNRKWARALVTVRLSGPSERRVTVRLTGRRGKGGPVVRRAVTIAPGETEATATVRVRPDPAGGVIRVPFRITGARNARPRGGRAVAVIDPPSSSEAVG